MPIHVFFDNSNIWLGARKALRDREPTIDFVAFRIHYGNLFKLMEKERQADTRVLAGSIPPACEPLWEYAEDHGYGTNLLRRVENEYGVHEEQGVDELLHLKMANVLLDFSPPQTMVVATGDGSVSNFGTGFLTQIQRALKCGWHVELYSWEGATNRKYRELAQSVPEQFKLIFLDEFYSSITFIKAGEYYRKDSKGEKIYFRISGRVVKQLPRL
ncbi:MAG: NYN domain-containing protein [Reyranellaceae bacterium]